MSIPLGLGFTPYVAAPLDTRTLTEAGNARPNSNLYEGLLNYKKGESSGQALKYWDGSAWQPIASGSGGNSYDGAILYNPRNGTAAVTADTYLSQPNVPYKLQNLTGALGIFNGNTVQHMIENYGTANLLLNAIFAGTGNYYQDAAHFPKLPAFTLVATTQMKVGTGSFGTVTTSQKINTTVQIKYTLGAGSAPTWGVANNHTDRPGWYGTAAVTGVSDTSPTATTDTHTVTWGVANVPTESSGVAIDMTPDITITATPTYSVTAVLPDVAGQSFNVQDELGGIMFVTDNTRVTVTITLDPAHQDGRVPMTGADTTTLVDAIESTGFFSSNSPSVTLGAGTVETDYVETITISLVASLHSNVNSVLNKIGNDAATANTRNPWHGWELHSATNLTVFFQNVPTLTAFQADDVPIVGKVVDDSGVTSQIKSPLSTITNWVFEGSWSINATNNTKLDFSATGDSSHWSAVTVTGWAPVMWQQPVWSNGAFTHASFAEYTDSAVAMYGQYELPGNSATSGAYEQYLGTDTVTNRNYHTYNGRAHTTTNTITTQIPAKGDAKYTVYVRGFGAYCYNSGSGKTFGFPVLWLPFIPRVIFAHAPQWGNQVWEKNGVAAILHTADQLSTLTGYSSNGKSVILLNIAESAATGSTGTDVTGTVVTNPFTGNGNYQVHWEVFNTDTHLGQKYYAIRPSIGGEALSETDRGNTMSNTPYPMGEIGTNATAFDLTIYSYYPTAAERVAEHSPWN